MSNRFGVRVGAILCLLLGSRASWGQSIRGIVIDAANNPVAGVVMQLVDTADAVTARALSNDRGEFRLVAPRAGSFRIASLRIGYRPSVSPLYHLAASSNLVERIALSGVQLSLDTVRVVARNSCRLSLESSAETFAVWEQARTALLAADLTRSANNVTATTIVHERTLDAAGRRTLKQTSAVFSQRVKQPWRTMAPDTLHLTGYVVHEPDNSTSYYAPGIDMLVSNTFLEDHCFWLVSDNERLGIAFEPIRERSRITEIKGTLWIDRATLGLREMRFQFVNLPPELEANSGGELEFARLSGGAWAIARWNLRMPVFEQRLRARSYGGNSVQLVQMLAQGGELVLAVRGNDTLWSQPPRQMHGVVRDSVTGAGVPHARIVVAGGALNGESNSRGEFAISSILPGQYTLQVHTPSLDSVNAFHQQDVSFADTESQTELRVPTGPQLLGAVCGLRTGNGTGVVFGRVLAHGDANIPRDTRVVVEWGSYGFQGAGPPVRVGATPNRAEVRTDSLGVFRVCALPLATSLAVRAISDSGASRVMELQILPTARFASVGLQLDRSVRAMATLIGAVLLDSVGTPVVGAEVSVSGGTTPVLTNESGAFHIRDIVPGPRHLTVRRIGYGVLEADLTFGAGQTLHQTVFLSRATTLSEVNVSASRILKGFEERRKLGLGSFITPEEMARQEGRKLGDIMMQIRGVQIIRDGQSVGPAYVSSSRRHTCIQGLPCPPDYLGGHCYARIYLDGILMNPGMPTQPFDINQFSAFNLEALEYYAGAASVPAEFSSLNANCGVVAAWTRSTR